MGKIKPELPPEDDKFSADEGLALLEAFSTIRDSLVRRQIIEAAQKAAALQKAQDIQIALIRGNSASN